MTTNHTILKILTKLPQNRQMLGYLLMDSNWFKNTEPKLQKEILTLPENFEGYIYDLSQRSDILGEFELKKLKKIAIGEYLITSVFEVYSRTAKKVMTKEYVSWNLGSKPGIKGIILIKTDNQISHFVIINSEKFPVGKITIDSLGGLTHFSPHEAFLLSNQIKKSLEKKLNVKNLKILEVIDLGRLEVDNGLTSNFPGIFAIVIENNQIDPTPGRGKIEIVPIEQLSLYISKIDDAFFLSTISRLLAKKVISI